jgi:hypothetical protein
MTRPRTKPPTTGTASRTPIRVRLIGTSQTHWPSRTANLVPTDRIDGSSKVDPLLEDRPRNVRPVGDLQARPLTRSFATHVVLRGSQFISHRSQAVRAEPSVGVTSRPALREHRWMPITW